MNAGGVSTHLVPEWDFHAIAAVDPGAQLIVAALRSDGRFGRSASGNTFELAIGPGLLPPVIAEFSPGQLTMVAAASDTALPATIQHVVFLDPFAGEIGDVPISSPPLRFLSLAGFANLNRLEAVVADSAGGIHLIDEQGNVRSVDAGGPLAGEVLCADLDGDFESDLLALRRDGTLLAWNSALQPLAGFPRSFPLGAAESPAIGDSNGQRFIAVVDTTGHLWSLPVGPAIGPAPWPAASGGGGRSRYLGFADGTPVHPNLTALEWTWNGGNGGNSGSLCWSGMGLSELVRLRASVSGSTVAEAAPRDQGCMTLSARHPGERILLEGQERSGGWLELGTLILEPPAGLRVGVPRPNPFHAETHIDVSGAGGPIEVEVLDLSGRLVWSRHAIASEILWSGVDDLGRRVPAGLYFLRVSDPKQSVVRRLLRLD